jgi:TM2 domain-containing membrane protein YozV
MKKTITSKLVLLMFAMAIFVASCSSNATFSKRYHNRGFNIAWGGGSDANKSVVKTSPKKVKVQTQSSEVAKNEENTVVESVVESVAVSQIAPTVNAVEMNASANTMVSDVKMANELTTIAAKSTKLNTKGAHVLKAANTTIKSMKKSAAPADGYSQIIALVLCIFVGVLGIHRFYLGYTMEGVLMLLTGGGCGIWWIIDLIRIVTGDLKPKDGDYTETL